MGEATGGVYVHVPFCTRRCDYCAFATWTDRAHLMADYVEACRRELEAAAPAPATTVFFGGGTPSLLPPELLASLLAAVPRRADAEVTVECNPETVTPALLRAYREAGVTRLSFGVQSMVPHVLVGLGRQHAPGSVPAAVAAAREAGFESWNVDLVYGGAGESVDDWRRTLEEVLALEPPHVSAYALTVEPGTPLAADAARHPDDDDQAEKYLLAEDALVGAGLRNYEVSNWAQHGHECRHNLLYWRQGDYRGIGCAAHSHRAGRRWWNVRTPERYIAAVAAGASVVAGEEVLDDEARAAERLQLALRTRDGVPRDALDADDEALDGLVEPADRPGFVRLTPRGRLLATPLALFLDPGR
ncbi:MAG TPA: radical SAM family heme chaperone HemW [Acidimicrobiales bacterium]|nr:radical SAM family heme chaperone HemW [Acidimicrobiales bacterium]